MKFIKPYAATLGSLVLLAMSLPVSAQETTQSTTVTQTPDQQVTQTTTITTTPPQQSFGEASQQV